MKALKISLLIFILPVIISAQENRIMYSPPFADRTVLFADGFESVIEFKCYEEESDTGNNFILLNKIRNFSNENIIWDLTKFEMYSSEKQFKPVGHKIIADIDNVDNLFPNILNLQPVEEIKIKSKTSLSILLMFIEWENNEKYETFLEDVYADIIVGIASLKNKQNQQWIFRMIYFKKT